MTVANLEATTKRIVEDVSSGRKSLGMPSIGIVSSWQRNPQDKRRGFYGVRPAYCEALRSAGADPLIIPLGASVAVLDYCDGLLFAGGEDIAPTRYGSLPHPKLGKVLVERDELELALLTPALERKVPILGICRGHQLLNVGCGGSLYQDIPSEIPGAGNHNPDDFFSLTELLAIKPNTKLHTILGVSEIGANSSHHQAVREVGKELRVSARTKDGVIEGLEHTEHPFCLSVQCHPEGLYAGAEPRWLRLFESFVEAARKTT